MRLPVKRVNPEALKPNPNITTLKKIISGGQPGVELAGLKAAKEVGYKTGGHILYDFETVHGDKPGYSWMFGLKDDCFIYEDNEEYKEVIWRNVIDADATIRLAVNFNTPDEYTTLRAIRQYRKLHLDIYLEPMWYAGNGEWEIRVEPQEVAAWLEVNKVRTLNVSGNYLRHLEAPAYFLLLEALNILRWE